MIRTRLLLSILTCLVPLMGQAQPGQLELDRISRMPDLPAPLHIRDWKQVTRNYDQLVFDRSLTGPHLPLLRLGTPGQFNYPSNVPLFLDTYVGASGHTNQAEAINILPALIGATLTGLDKSQQDGLNYVSMSRDFFNVRNGQNVYLNNYVSASGNDWWYDVMPNVYFYQLRALYPQAAPEYDAQFEAIAQRWLGCVTRLGGSTTPWSLPYMNYRAFNLITGEPLATGVPEPEAAGSIAWLLYNAYLHTGNHNYLLGAQLALEFLSQWESNPSYELQLPYGTLAAARMNAVEGTDYPLQKMLDWCFDRGNLRNWGAMVGRWGDFDVSGLIGEANDGGNDYAFIMNGFQQAAALAPLPKYDKRYARALGKWILNLANASRLFYWNALPALYQDSYEWASVHDPTACLPHESMKEVWGGHSPYATGDAIRGGWASTNLSLYSGSSVGYLAAVIDTTDVPGILLIDMNKTDFYGHQARPAYLIFNPYPDTREIDISLPDGMQGIYEALTETLYSPTSPDSYRLRIPGKEARLIRLYPAGDQLREYQGKLFAGDEVLDYHYRYDYTPILRIKALSIQSDTVRTGADFIVWCEPGNISEGEEVQFQWFRNESLLTVTTVGKVEMRAPDSSGLLSVRCRILSGDQSAEASLSMWVAERIPQPPRLTGIQSGSKFTPVNQVNTFTMLVEEADGEELTFSWSASGGEILSDGQTLIWKAPNIPATVLLTAAATNQDNLSSSLSGEVLVKDTSLPQKSPLIWYPFDQDERNAQADRFHATATDVLPAEDPRGEPHKARQFTSGSSLIVTDNSPDLNFTQAVSLSCWVKPEQWGSERFIISHGSWQQRYKLSITPEGFVRWTVKTDQGVCDLDASENLLLNRYCHLTALYTGYSMELYVDGELDTFKGFSGSLLTTTKPFTLGRMDPTETQYALRGSLDEVKVWDSEISVSQIARLKDEWVEPEGKPGDSLLPLYPNPSDGSVWIGFNGTVTVKDISVFSSDGRIITDYRLIQSGDGFRLSMKPSDSGLYLIRILLANDRILTGKVIIR